MAPVVNLPVGSHPGWELNDDDMNIEGTPFHRISESGVLLQSLRQSRDHWITHTFPKFSTRSRGKQAELSVPHHTPKFHGKVELHVEPHVYSDTALYEVRYLPQANSAAAAPQQQAQSTTSAAPSSPFYDGAITPELLTSVTEAASNNPEINRLLQLAYHNKASPEEAQALSLFIRSLVPAGAAPSDPSMSPQNAPQLTPIPVQPVRQFDIVIEYQERPSDRWRIPRTTAYCERIRVGERQDVRLTLQLPFPQEDLSGASETNKLPPQIVQMYWAGLHENTAKLFVAWCGGEEKMAESWKKMQEIKQLRQGFLPYQLPDGEYLNRIQAALAPAYTMKPIKPANADSTRARKRTTRRQSTSKNAKGAVAASPMPANTAATLTTDTGSTSQNTPAPLGNHPPDASTTAQNYQFMMSQESSPPSPAPAARAYIGAPLAQHSSQHALLHTQTHAPPHIPRTSLAAVLAPVPAFAPVPHAGYYIGAPPPRSARSRSSSAQPTAQQQQGRAAGPSTVASGSAGSSQAPQPETQDALAPSKRRRSYQRKGTQAQPVPIACRSCGQTDVPLMMGGRFCRACIDGGRADEYIPEVTLRYPPFASTMTPAPRSYTTPTYAGAAAPAAASPLSVESPNFAPFMTHSPLGPHSPHVSMQAHSRPDTQP